MKKILIIFLLISIFYSCSQPIELATQGTLHDERITGLQAEPEPEPEPEPVYLPSSIEILAMISSDIHNAGGRIVNWQYNEDSDPFIVIQTQEIGMLAVYQICNQYEYAYLQNVKEEIIEEEQYITIFLNALRTDYDTFPVEEFPAPAAAISVINEIKNRFWQHEININNEELPTLDNGNTSYTFVFNTNDINLVNSLKIMNDLCANYTVWIKELNISINSIKSEFTVSCIISNGNIKIPFELNESIDVIPVAFGYKEPEPEPEPVYLPPSTAILMDISRDIANEGGNLINWRYNEDEENFIIFQVNDIDSLKLFEIFDDYEYVYLQDVKDTISNDEQFLTVYVNAFRKEYAVYEVKAFPSSGAVIPIVTELKDSLWSEGINIISEVLPTLSNGNTSYNLTYICKDMNLISSLDIITEICNSYPLRIKAMDISISTDKSLFTVNCTISHTDKHITLALGDEKEIIPAAFGYKEFIPEPVPEPVYLPLSMEILSRISEDIACEGGEILHWQYNEDSDPYITITTREIDMLAVYNIFNIYDYVYVQDVKEDNINGEKAFTSYIYAVRNGYSTYPVIEFPAQDTAIKLITNFKNNLLSIGINIISDILPTINNGNSSYSVTYTSKDHNLISSFELFNELCNNHSLSIKYLDISINSEKDLFTVTCTISHTEINTGFEIDDAIKNLPELFGYREPEPEPEPVYLPSSINILERISYDVAEAGGRILSWRYNEDEDPLIIFQIQEINILTLYSIFNQHEYAYIHNINDNNVNGEIIYTVYLYALRTEYTIYPVKMFSAPDTSIPIIANLKDNLLSEGNNIISDVLPTINNGNASYTLTYTANDENLISSLELINDTCNLYSLHIKYLNITISDDRSQFTVTCTLSNTEIYNSMQTGDGINSIPAAFGYMEPVPPPDPVYLPSSIEILENVSADIAGKGGKILRWQHNEDTDPILTVQIQGINTQEVYRVFNNYNYIYIYDVKEGSDNGEKYLTVYIYALRTEYSVYPVKTFPLPDTAIPVINELTNNLEEQKIIIISEILPTINNGNNSYTLTYTSKDTNLISSLEEIINICNRYAFNIKKLDVSINSDKNLFTVTCMITHTDMHIIPQLGNGKNKIPEAFGYKEPVPPPAPVYLPSSIEILANVSNDIYNRKGRILSWQYNEDSDPFIVLQIQGIDSLTIYQIFNQYKYMHLLDVTESVKNGEPYFTIYLNSLRTEYSVYPAAAFNTTGTAYSMIDELKYNIEQENITIVSDTLPTVSNGNNSYTFTYTSINTNLIRSLEIINSICNKYMLRIKNTDISINSNRNLFTVSIKVTHTGMLNNVQLGSERNIIPVAFGYREPVRRRWTFIVYMAADNDLESAAIADLNEMEAVQLDNEPISIIVLLDRNPGYDSTNGNWSGTRVYEVKTDPGGQTSTIISEQLNCPELGLNTNTEIDLNTADPLVLSNFIDFAKKEYPADNYALFMWGHGTGWRGGTQNETLPMPFKAVAIDDTRGEYMSLPSFGRAISGKGMSLIGFDTCFAALLEVVYQIRNHAQVFVGSVGEIMSTGWDYRELFNNFLQRSSLSIYDLGNAIQHQFSIQYPGISNASISQISLQYVNELFTAFDDFAGAVAGAITDKHTRDIILDLILNNVESYYFTGFSYGSFSDLYIDINDFKNKIIANLSSITEDTVLQTAITNAANDLDTALEYAVYSSWVRNGGPGRIGVHVIPLKDIGVPAPSHGLAYIKNSKYLEKSAFVENSVNWVPNSILTSGSLLNKLFYWTF